MHRQKRACSPLAQVDNDRIQRSRRAQIEGREIDEFKLGKVKVIEAFEPPPRNAQIQALPPLTMVAEETEELDGLDEGTHVRCADGVHRAVYGESEKSCRARPKHPFGQELHIERRERPHGLIFTILKVNLDF